MLTRIPIMALATLILSANAVAKPCDEVEGLDARLACFDWLADCAGIESDARRLVCYESRAAGISQPTGQLSAPPGATSPSGEAQAPGSPSEGAASSAPSAARSSAEASASDKTAADDEAFPVRGQPRDDEEPTIEATITRVRKNVTGIIYLDLDNGQVWKETQRSKFRFEPGQEVTITRGTFGSSNLHAAGMRKYTKAVRVD